MAQPELVNIVGVVEEKFHSAPWAPYLLLWENIIFSLAVVIIISTIAYFASRKRKFIPGRLQAAAEMFVSVIDDFTSGVLGSRGRKYTPFIGTLFIYILFMNFFGLIPFMKSPTSSWSTTFALAACVFIYVQYTAIKELGFIGYIDHLMGRPRGFMALSVVFPVMMLFLHIVSELVRPITLSLRLRSNVWGDDVLLAVLSGFGIQGVPLYIFSTLLVIIASLVQAMVFCLLTTIYFALIMEDTEEKTEVQHGL